MNYKELAEKAREIKADGERFLAQYENEIVDFLREDAEDAESRLQKEIFFEFLDNLHGMCHPAGSGRFHGGIHQLLQPSPPSG